MLALGLGMQLRPRPHAHHAVLLVLDGKIASGRGPCLGCSTGELVAMTSGTPSAWLCGRVSGETASRAQAHQDANRRLPKGLRELDRVLASSEDEPRQGAIRWHLR